MAVPSVWGLPALATITRSIEDEVPHPSCPWATLGSQTRAGGDFPGSPALDMPGVLLSPHRFGVIRIWGESSAHPRSKMPLNSSERVLQKPLTPNCEGCSKMLLFLMGLSSCRAWSGAVPALWRGGNKGEEKGACGRTDVHNPGVKTINRSQNCSRSQITHGPFHC